VLTYICEFIIYLIALELGGGGELFALDACFLQTDDIVIRSLKYYLPEANTYSKRLGAYEIIKVQSGAELT